MDMGKGQKKYLIFAVVAISIPFLLVLILPRVFSTQNQAAQPSVQRSIDKQTLDQLTPTPAVPVESSPSPEASKSVKGVKITQ